MTRPSLRCFTLALLVLVVTSACSGSPTAPSVDPPVTTPPPAPLAQSYVRLVRTMPSEGQTLKADVADARGYLLGDHVYIYVESGISQADLDEGARIGAESIVVTACLSVNGKSIVGRKPGDLAGGSCRTRTPGQSEHELGVLRASNPDVNQTNYVIIWLSYRTTMISHLISNDHPFKTEVVPVVYYWK